MSMKGQTKLITAVIDIDLNAAGDNRPPMLPVIQVDKSELDLVSNMLYADWPLK